jgi:voltage-gated potassium channel
MFQEAFEVPAGRRLVIGVLTLLCVIGVGTSGYVLIEGWSFIDALYMAVTTVTTVGFREVNELSTTGRVFTIAYVLTGVGVAFYILTAMVAVIIEGDLGQIFGVRRMRMSINELSDHFIICGYGRVGAEVAHELMARQVPFVVVDYNPEVQEHAKRDKVLMIASDATDADVLREAGIERCKALIAASDSDANNTYITLTAKSLRPDVFVVARVGTPEVAPKLRQAGADRLVSPYAIGGRRMALAALQPIITDFIDLFSDATHGGRLLAEVVVDTASGLEGETLGDVLSRCKEVVALAVMAEDGQMKVGPASTTKLQAGDRLTLVGDEHELRSIGAIRAQ